MNNLGKLGTVLLRKSDMHLPATVLNKAVGTLTGHIGAEPGAVQPSPQAMQRLIAQEPQNASTPTGMPLSPKSKLDTQSLQNAVPWNVHIPEKKSEFAAAIRENLAQYMESTQSEPLDCSGELPETFVNTSSPALLPFAANVVEKDVDEAVVKNAQHAKQESESWPWPSKHGKRTEDSAMSYEIDLGNLFSESPSQLEEVSAAVQQADVGEVLKGASSAVIGLPALSSDYDMVEGAKKAVEAVINAGGAVVETAVEAASNNKKMVSIDVETMQDRSNDGPGENILLRIIAACASGVKSLVHRVGGVVTLVFSKVGSLISSAIGGMANLALSFLSNVSGYLKDSFLAAFGGLYGAAQSVIGACARAVELVQGAWSYKLYLVVGVFILVIVTRTAAKVMQDLATQASWEEDFEYKEQYR